MIWQLYWSFMVYICRFWLVLQKTKAKKAISSLRVYTAELWENHLLASQTQASYSQTWSMDSSSCYQAPKMFRFVCQNNSSNFLSSMKTWRSSLGNVVCTAYLSLCGGVWAFISLFSISSWKYLDFFLKVFEFLPESFWIPSWKFMNFFQILF